MGCPSARTDPAREKKAKEGVQLAGWVKVRLDEIDRDVKLGKVQFDDVAEQVCMPKREDRSSKGKESKGGCPPGWMGEGEAWTDRTALGKARIRLMGIV